MTQTTTMAKLRGRHYAAKARASQIASGSTAGSNTKENTNPPAQTTVDKTNVSNESLVRRLRTSRLNNRIHSPSARDALEHTANNNNNNNDHNNNRTNPATSGRDRTTSRIPSRVRGGRITHTEQKQQKPTGRNSNDTDKVSKATPDREMEIVKGISDRLETGLNEDALGAILDLLKRGEQPDAVVAVVTSLAQQART